MGAVLHFLAQLLQFVTDHESTLIAVAPLVFALIKSTQWGRSHQQALIKVAGVIESVGDKTLKADVAARFETATDAEKDALAHVVNVVDPKKSPATRYEQLVIEVVRGLMPKEKERGQ